MVLQLKTPEDLKDLYIGIAIVRYALNIAILVINGGILLAFLIQRWRHQRPKRRLHPAGCFVINLLIADTLVGAVLTNSLRYKIWPENAVALAKKHYACVLRFAVAFLAVCGSHNALLSVVIDRYVAVVHTMRYRDWMSRRTCVLMVTASWILPVTGMMYLLFFGHWKPGLPICSENTVIGDFSLYVWLPIQVALLLSILVIQFCVHFELRRYGKTKSFGSSVLHRSTHKSAKTMLISTLAFAFFYAPYDATALVFVFFPSALTKLLYDLSAIGTALTFLVNPCLYSIKTESVRRPVSELFSDIRGALSRLKTRGCFDQPATEGPTAENGSSRFDSNRNASIITLNTSLGVSGV